MATPRFTRAYVALVLAWLPSAAFALGFVVTRGPLWFGIAALLGVMAVAPMAPDGAIPYLIGVLLIFLLLTVATAPTLWR